MYALHVVLLFMYTLHVVLLEHLVHVHTTYSCITFVDFISICNRFRPILCCVAV